MGEHRGDRCQRAGGTMALGCRGGSACADRQQGIGFAGVHRGAAAHPGWQRELNHFADRRMVVARNEADHVEPVGGERREVAPDVDDRLQARRVDVATARKRQDDAGELLPAEGNPDAPTYVR